MSFSDDQIQQVTAALSAITDPTERAQAVGDMLSAIPALQRALREERRAAVLDLREAGYSHAQVAAELGISRGRAQQIAEGRTS
ncbi:Homeodomain-like domain-containing protein [Haloactinospora alba]|uniref:Homeodomain-like domain-containing protein n=1 Tax=Haloactinospora alba TaxID=405555 RepID=A0A543N6Q7_9ACTN|nr:helix-turn-helix domain-containing protein [Haloactinospora alba]TQN27487.1 Homeodomain-like domain-containing protein [Haloactinospora alba]